MRIEISNYVITSESRNIILNKAMTVQEGERAGEEYLSPIGFYSTVEQAMKAVGNHKIKQSEATSIKELMKEVREIRKLIEEVLEGV